MHFREITVGDVPALFLVRTAVKVNAFTREALTRLGITEGSVQSMLGRTHRGWLCELEGGIVGFALGDGTTGEVWVVAVLPEHEGKGIGTRLLALVEDWLWSLNWNELWLWTSPDPTLRAHHLYTRRGWVDSSVRDGQLIMKKKRAE